MGQLTLRLDENKKKIEEYEKKTKYFSECYDMEKALHYVEIPKEIPEDAAHIRSYLESDVKALDKDSVIRDLNKLPRAAHRYRKFRAECPAVSRFPRGACGPPAHNPGPCLLYTSRCV